jgi:hypothetical protein
MAASCIMIGAFQGVARYMIDADGVLTVNLFGN